MAWRPMATAPKDGTMVLVSVMYPADEVGWAPEVHVAYWTGRAWWAAGLDMNNGPIGHVDCPDGIGQYDFRAFAVKPEAWLPMPEPPAGAIGPTTAETG